MDSHAEQNLPGQDEWVDEVSEVLSQLGVTPESTVDDIKPIVESLGFQIPVLEVDHGGMLSTYVLYHAQLFDPKDHFNSPGYFSRKSLHDALAVALAFGLMARRERPGAWCDATITGVVSPSRVVGIDCAPDGATYRWELRRGEIDTVLRDEIRSRAEALAAELDSGVFGINECRED